MESEKERISELEERAVEITSIWTLEEKNRPKKREPQDLWAYNQRSNIFVSKEEKGERKALKVFKEIMAE